MIDQDLLPAAIPLVLPVELRDRHMALVDHREVVLGEVVEQRVGRLAGLAAVEMPGIVLDAVAVPQFPHHFEVVRGPHPQSLRLEQLVVLFEPGEALGELHLDPFHGRPQSLSCRHVVRCRVDERLGQLPDDLSGHRVHLEQSIDLVTEVLDSQDRLLVGGHDLEGVAPDAESAPGEVDLVALVLDVHEAPHRILEGVLDPLHDAQQLSLVLLRRPEPVDRGHRGHDDDVPAGQERRRRRVA